MKKIINSAYQILTIGILLVVFVSCEEKEVVYEPPITAYPEITISDFTPKSGHPTEPITITGSNFGEYSDAAKIYFNGVLATDFDSYTDSQMVVRVPKGAGDGPIAVNVWTHSEIFQEDFEYLPGIEIESISPYNGKSGDTVVVTGIRFGDDASIVNIFIGENEAEVVSVNNEEIVYLVPAPPSGILEINVGLQQYLGEIFLISDPKIEGTIVGHATSWDGSHPVELAFDGDIETFNDPGPDDPVHFLGYDFGEGNLANVTSIRYCPRKTKEDRMVGGQIVGANDLTFENEVVLYTITEKPVFGYTEANITATESYRYIYYRIPDALKDDKGWGNVAEIEFFGSVSSK